MRNSIWRVWAVGLGMLPQVMGCVSVNVASMQDKVPDWFRERGREVAGRDYPDLADTPAIPTDVRSAALVKDQSDLLLTQRSALLADLDAAGTLDIAKAVREADGLRAQMASEMAAFPPAPSADIPLPEFPDALAAQSPGAASDGSAKAALDAQAARSIRASGSGRR